MEEFRKLVNFVLLMLTTLALKKTATSDLSSFIPTLSVRDASQSLYELWDDPFGSAKSSPAIKLAFRRKPHPVIVPPIVNGHCELAAHNYTLLTAQSYNEWFAQETQTSLLRTEPPVKQPHLGIVVIFRKHYRITALILSDMVADAFKAAWNSPTFRRLIKLLTRWGSTFAFWLTSIAGAENVYAFEQFRAALFRRRGKCRYQTAVAPASNLLSVPPSLPPADPVGWGTRANRSSIQPPTRRVPPLASPLKTTVDKSDFALDLERQLDRALRPEYTPPSLADIVPVAAEESLVALEYISLLEDAVQAGVSERDAAAEMRKRMCEYLPPASDEEPEEVVVAKRDKADLPIRRAIKRPRRSVEEIVGQVIKAPKELTEEEKEAQEEERRRRAILVRTFLYTSVPRMPPRFPPLALCSPYLDSADAVLDAGGLSAYTVPPRFAGTAPPIVLHRGPKSLVVMRIASASDPKVFRGVRQEMRALMLLADCEWAARLVCYCSKPTYVEIQLRYYAPERSFRSMMSQNGGFLSYRAAVFYLAELMVAIQAFQSYGLIHTDLCIDDLTISPRGDIIVQNFDCSEIFYGGRLPHWIPRHENYFKQKPFGYDDYLRAAYLYYEMLTGVVLEGGVGPLSRNRKQQDNRKQEPRTVDFDFIHFVTGTYPILPRSANAIFEHALFGDINWRAIKDQTAAVPICHNTLRELEGD